MGINTDNQHAGNVNMFQRDPEHIMIEAVI